MKDKPISIEDCMSVDLRSIIPNESTFYIDRLEALMATREAAARVDPFDFVESCEPSCSDVRHAYHEGQWDMATRMTEALTQDSKD